MHTYSMRDCPRERYIFLVTLAALAVLAIAKQTAGYFGVVMSVTTFSVFGVLYFAFDRWLWRIPLVGNVIGIPNLAGQWTIQGKTDGADGVPRNWEGTVTIEQTWSHIAISIETEHSRVTCQCLVTNTISIELHFHRILFSHHSLPVQGLFQCFAHM